MKKNFTECVVFTALLAMAMTVISSCKDDDTEITDPGTDVVTVDSTLLKSDAEVYEYIMSQFVKLNNDSTLKERTRFTRQLNEADSTDVYARTTTADQAHKLFLQLIPDENGKLVKANKDSSEMTYTFSNGLRALTYRESSNDANVMATITLPSYGAYRKFVNTLTLIKSWGSNDDGTYYISHELGKYKEFTIPMYFGNDTSAYYNSKTNNSAIFLSPSHYKFTIKQKKVHMLCFYIDISTNTFYYVFIPPVANCQIKYDDGDGYPYLMQSVFSYFWNPNHEEDKEPLKYCDNLSEVDVLPSVETNRTFLNCLWPDETETHKNGSVTNAYNHYRISQWPVWYLFYGILMNNWDMVMTDEQGLRNGTASDKATELWNRFTLYFGNPALSVPDTYNYLQSSFMYFDADGWTYPEDENMMKSYSTGFHAVLHDSNLDNLYALLNRDSVDIINLSLAFASKDVILMDSAGARSIGEYDESDYYAYFDRPSADTTAQAKADYKKNCNNPWALIQYVSSTAGPYQKYAAFYQEDLRYGVQVRGRNVLNTKPVRPIYIVKETSNLVNVPESLPTEEETVKSNMETAKQIFLQHDAWSNIQTFLINL